MQPLFDGMGRGWYFTFLGLVSGISGALCVAAIWWKGMEWRVQRWKREREKQADCAGAQENDTGKGKEDA